MSIKRTKHRVGPFGRGHIDAEMNDDGAFEAISEVIKANKPAGLIAAWLPHAERLGVAGDLLDQAAALIDENGCVDNIDRFDALMARAQLKIEQAQNEHIDVYGLAGSRARQNDRLVQDVQSRGKRKSQESEAMNRKLIAWDDDIAAQHPRLKQPQRARKILWDYKNLLPSNIATSKPESLAKRIRQARKKLS